ncbi:Nitrate transporter [Nitrospira sp. KM1]|uniref:MFS transporter n=1 Tax=Nitrospira sp. KM1 TaxID=1936990 RepID=UPI0013A7B29A|nr:MFS transporter [Nitrospira sp. KM1]BCA56822.1 Nitrate transporter [Nitrospira sp. KM1]
MNIVTILRSGHWPSLAGAWLHLTISFMVWLMVGAMSIPLVRDLNLSEHETAWLIALPLLGGAVCRVVAGWSADWIGARRTAVAILAAEVATLLWGWLGVEGYQQAVLFASCLGIAGASFAVALPIAGRAYPPTAQGFVLGLAASGNIGTVLILFLAPRWTMTMSWHGVCGLMAGASGITLVVFLLLVPAEGPRQAVGSAGWWHHAAGLIRRRTAYWLCFLYAVTFGGFVGLCSVLPLLVHDVYKMEAVQAGALAAVCGLVGSLVRPLGGYVADKHGGLRTLYIVLPVVAGSVVAVTSPSLFMAVSMMVLSAGAMGFGNGVVFQLVAEWFPKDIGLASGIVGAVGSLGGFGLPMIIGTVKGFTGTYDLGLWIFAGFAISAWGTVIVALKGLHGSRTEP